MSATILAFPRSAITVPAMPSPIGATALAEKFSDHYLPVVQASVDLLGADEAEFERRCRGMLDAEGGTMVDELCAEMQIVGRQMQTLVDGLALTRARLRTAMARCGAAPMATDRISSDQIKTFGSSKPLGVPDSRTI